LYSSQKSKIVSGDEIIQYLDSNEINKAVIFGFPWESDELVRINNDEIWNLHQRYPDRIVPFGVLSTLGGDKAHRETERTLKAGFAGIGELAMYHGGWSLADFEALSPSLDIVESFNVPVVIHVNEPVGHDYPGKIPVDFRGLMRIIRAYPHIDFVLAHMGGGLFVYGLMPEVRKIMHRTYFDTAASPFLYDPKVLAVASDILGSEKILFGSDFPLLGLKRYARDIETSGIDEIKKSHILGLNGQRLLANKHHKSAHMQPWLRIDEV
jgi:predicted TIM-barrel fold metal-dependent hydrolase